MISVRGRGTRAANMTSLDAAVLLIAIGSGASGRFVAEVTRMLKAMELSFAQRPDRFVVLQMCCTDAPGVASR
jgi:hypothetical protein